MATDNKLQSSVSEFVHQDISNKQDAKATNETFTQSVFVNSEPMREEQVQNAMKFLSHPKVKGSPIMYRRSFLEKKGLTKEEIDEAFHRVPDPPSNASSVQATSTNQERQFNPASNVQQQTLTHDMKPAAPAGGITKAGLLTKYRFHWSHAFLAVGLLTASGAGTVVLIRNTLLPKLKSWIRKIVLDEDADIVNKTNLKPSLEEEAVAAAKTAAAAAVEAAKASQEMLYSKESRYFEEFTSLLGVQVQEMKSMRNAIQKLEGQSSTSGRTLYSEQDYYRGSGPSVKQPNVNGNMDADMYSVRSSAPPATATTSLPSHPKSYMEPWEVEQVQYSEVQGNGLIASITNDAPALPWWQQEKAKISEIETEAAEVDNSSRSPVVNEAPPKLMWVPPQPPPVAMAEAAAAIRQPKTLIRKEQTADDQSTSNSSDGIDELQRIQKQIAESGGALEVETNGGSYEMNSGKIEEEVS